MAKATVSPAVLSGVKSVMSSLRSIRPQGGQTFVEAAREAFTNALANVPAAHRRNVKRKIQRDFSQIFA